MGGTLAELLASSELKQLFSKVLRRDFQLVETYRLVAGRKPLNGSVMILYGHGDTMASAEPMKEWAGYIEGKMRLCGFEDGHFFIFVSAKEVTETINEYLFAHIEREASCEAVIASGVY